MFDAFRGDVSGMKTVIRAYLAWPFRHSFSENERVGVFAEQFLATRFSVPVGSAESRQTMHAIALIAFPEFCEELNHDGTPSLLALLGAVCEAERIVIDPGIVARGCRKYFTDEISGKILGGMGVADIDQAFRNGTRRFHESRAAMQRYFQ